MFRFFFRRRDPEDRPQKISYIPWQLQLAVILFVIYVIFQDHSLRERVTPDPKGKMERLIETEQREVKEVMNQAAELTEDMTEPEIILNQTTIKRGEGAPLLCGDKLTVHLTATDDAGTIVMDTTAADTPKTISLGETLLHERLTPVLSTMRMGEIRQVYLQEEGESPLTIDLALMIVEHRLQDKLPFGVHTYTLTTGDADTLRCGEYVTLTMRYFAPDNPKEVLHQDTLQLPLHAEAMPIALLRSLLEHRRGDTLIAILPDVLFENSPLNMAEFPTSPAHFVALNVD